MPSISKEQLFSRALKRRNVPLPEEDFGPGAFIIVQELTGEQRDEYDSSLWMQRGAKKPKLSLEHATARLVVLSVVDEQGDRLFGDDEVLSVSRRLGAGLLKRIAEAAKELSGITDDEIEELAETKKSPSEGTGSPGSD